jgi:hypothetical protein
MAQTLKIVLYDQNILRFSQCVINIKKLITYTLMVIYILF